MREYFKKIIYIFGDSYLSLALFFLMFLFSSLLELLGLSLIGPYVSIFIDPENSKKYLLFINDLLRINLSNKEFILLVSSFIFLVVVIKTILIVITNYKIVKFAMLKQHLIRSRIFEVYQNLNYESYTKRSSSEYVHNLQTLVSQYTNNILINGIKSISELVVASFIIIFLVYKDPYTFSLLLLFLVTLILLYDRIFRKKLKYFGKISNDSSDKMLQTISESISGFKELKILDKLDFFKQKMDSYSKTYGESFSVGIVLGNIPRYFFELILILFIITCIIYNTLINQNVTALLPIIAVFCFASIRLVPASNILSRFIVQLRFTKDCVERLYDDLKRAKYTSHKNWKSTEQFRFNKLQFIDVSFRYKNSSNAIFSSINFEISKGDKIGLTGKSGSGKSTLVDLFLGLLTPSEGSLLLNGEKTKYDHLLTNVVAYLPQNYFLINDSIKRNIAIGEYDDSINIDKLRSAITKANLDHYVDTLPDGIDSIVEENGKNLSGGQKQRLVLARAFYFDREVFVLDESTSALDEETEISIVDELCLLDKSITLIFISHNFNTLRVCDKIYKVQDQDIIPISINND